MAKRLLLITASLIILLVVVAAGALYWFLSGDGIRRALEQQATAWLGQPVRIESARARFLPRIGIELGNVQAGEPARVTLRSVTISAALRPLLSRRIEDAEIILAGSRVELPLPFSLPTADETAPPDAGDATADTGGGVELVSVRAITLRDIVIASRGREITVSADSSLIGSRLELEQFTASSGRTELEASGTVELEPALDATLTVHADTLDLDEMMALAAAFSPDDAGQAPGARSESRAASAGASKGSGAAPRSDARIAATLTADVARSGEIEAQMLASQLQAEGDRLTLSPLSFQLFGGTYEGSMAATLGQAVTATIKSKITGLDVAQLAAFGGAAGTVTGRLSGDGTFSGQGADIESVLATAKGSGTASMTDGAIAKLDLVRTVVLFFGRPAPDGSAATDRYDRIDLRFSLANQVFRADAFSFDSPDVDIAGTGTLALRTKALDGAVTLLLSEALSAQAGSDLVRFTREGNRVALPGRLGGTLEAPRVTIDAKAAVTRGLRNEGERRLKGLLDGLLK